MKKLLTIWAFLLLILTNFAFAQNQNVSINTTGAPADNSAILDISSTEKGILIPRMNSAQREAISAPATGLLVYDTGHDSFWYYDGTQWVEIGGSGGATITAFSWDDPSDMLTITENGTDWNVTIDNEADDLSDNLLNDLSNVNANPTGTGQVLKWNGSEWYAGTDEAGSGGTVITAFTWDDPSNLLRITEGSTNWDVYINNEADDLSNNVINDLSNVNATPSTGDVLQWDGTTWVAGTPSSSCVTLDEAYDCGGNGAGRQITADAGSVEINSTSQNKPLLVTISAASTIGISAEHSNSGVAIAAGNTYSSTAYSTIQATTTSSSNLVSAVLGNSSGYASGVTGQIESSGTAFAGVFGNNLRTSGGTGVYGMGVNGVVGETNDSGGGGLWGINHSTTADGPGTYGVGYAGVYGQTQIGSGYGVLGENVSSSSTDNNIGVAGWGWVGVFGQTSGGGYGVYSDGDFASSGNKSFVIDDPIDPDNKMLKHYCAESPEVLNIYRGNVICDENGEAVVELPAYFESINKDFSYYLTPIGDAANLYVKSEVKGNSFVIAGGKKGLKVSWILYAKRNDKYMQAKYAQNEDLVEVPKKQPGKYIHPELWGKSSDDKLFDINTSHKLLKLKGQEEKPKTRIEQNILK